MSATHRYRAEMVLAMTLGVTLVTTGMVKVFAPEVIPAMAYAGSVRDGAAIAVEIVLGCGLLWGGKYSGRCAAGLVVLICGIWMIGDISGLIPREGCACFGRLRVEHGLKRVLIGFLGLGGTWLLGSREWRGPGASLRAAFPCRQSQ